MNTPATQPTDIDKRLEELLGALVDDRTCDEAGSAFRGGCTECERFSNKGVGAARRFFRDEKTGAALAAALHRARGTLRLIANEVAMLDYPGAAKEALADTELEELLR